MPSDKKQKGIAHMLMLIVVVVALGIGGYWMWRNDKLNVAVEGPSPTPAPTKTTGRIPNDWKTYTNAEFGISFRYPSDWYWENTPGYPTDETPINISFFEQGSEADHSFGDHIGNETFGVNLQKDSRTLQSIKDEYYKNADELQVSGKPTIKTSFNHYIVQLNDSYRLTIMSDNLDSEKVRMQILSTFEFVNNISSWKTYRNEEYGFTFKYPKSLNPDKRKTEEGNELFAFVDIPLEMQISSTSIKFCNKNLVANCSNYNFELKTSKQYRDVDFNIYDHLTIVGDICGPLSEPGCYEEKIENGEFNYIERVWEHQLDSDAFLQFELQDAYDYKNPKENLEYEQLVDQILSTFELTRDE